MKRLFHNSFFDSALCQLLRECSFILNEKRESKKIFEKAGPIIGKIIVNSYSLSWIFNG